MNETKKRVLYISYDGMTDPLGQSQILPYIICLSDTYTFQLISFEKQDRLLKHKETIEAICESNNIEWHPLIYTKNPPVLSTLIDVIKLFRHAKKLYKTNRFSIVHCRSYISALVGLAYKKKNKAQFIFDMRGFWADERVDGKLWNLKNPIYYWIFKFFKRKETEFLIHADAVVALTQKAKDEMLTWGIKALQANKITVIPCVTDFSLFESVTEEKRRLAKLKFNLRENQFVLLYLGSIGTWYLLDEMLHFFSCLKQINPDSKFLFLTNHSENDIKQRAVKYNLGKEDILVHFANRNEITHYAHAADYGVFFIKPLYSKIASSPTKMGEMLAMGIPLICNSGVGNVEEIVKETNCGFCVAGFSVTDYNQVIQSMYENKLDPASIRSKAAEFLELSKGIFLYKKIYALLG